MKVLCDVHIAKKVVRFFRDNGVESVHVNDILDSWYTKDEDIANYADDYDYTLMSKDADFKNSHLLKSSPKKLLKINLGNIPTKKLSACILSLTIYNQLLCCRIFARESRPGSARNSQCLKEDPP